MGLCWDKGGNALGQATFLPPFLCYSSVRTVRLHSPFVSGSLRISGLDGKLAAGCLRSGSAWIVFCFHCWVADSKNGVDDEVWHWVLGGGGYGPPLPLPRYLHLAVHCQSDKSGHQVPSFAHFSIIGTKLSGVRGSSPIFSRAVIASSRYSRNAGHSNRVCQVSSFHPLVSQLEHSGYPPASCGTGRH